MSGTELSPRLPGRMQQVDDQLILSASDLNNYLACRHLTALDLARARGETRASPERGADAELLARKGDEHEARATSTRSSERRARGGRDRHRRRLPRALAAAAAATEEAMRAGAEVIFQATFLADGLRGHADFLFRVERPSDLGACSYEVADTKLARRAKPYFILQLCFYSELLAAAQGLEPERIHVILGTREQHSFRLAEFSAYYRRVRDAFLADLAAGVPRHLPRAGRSLLDLPLAHASATSAASPTTTSASSRTSPGASASCLREAGITTLAALGSAQAASRCRGSGPRPGDAPRPGEAAARAREERESGLRAPGRRRRGGASRASPSPPPATSSSTSRATRSSRRRARVPVRRGSPAGGRRARVQGALGARPRRGAGGLRGSSSTSSPSGAGPIPTSTSTTTPTTR